MPVSCQQIACLGWPHCYRLANDKIELIITSDVGPRVIHISYVGGPNLFYQVNDELGQTGGEQYHIYGARVYA